MNFIRHLSVWHYEKRAVSDEIARFSNLKKILNKKHKTY